MIRHYVLTALRNLRQSPLVTGINVLTLSLGLVCFVIAYAVVGYWQSAERQFANADRTRLVNMTFKYPGGEYAPIQTSSTVAKYLRLDFPEFEAVARMVPRDVDDMGEMMVSAGAQKTTVTSIYADPDFLKIFNLPFVEGDPLTALNSPHSVVLTEEAAARLFPGENPMGQSLRVDGVLDATVTGVIHAVQGPSQLNGRAPGGIKFEVLASYDLYRGFWAAMDGKPVTEEEKDNWLGDINDFTYALLPKTDIESPAQLDQRLAEFAKRRVPDDVSKYGTMTFGTKPVQSLMTARIDGLLFLGGTGISFTDILMGLGALVLAVACLNYANLSAAQTFVRSREVGLRKVLGASRRQVLAQNFLEAGILAVTALAMAIAVTELIAPLLKTVVGIDLDVALFAGPGFWSVLALLVLGVTVVAGCYPALLLSRVRPMAVLRSDARKTGRNPVATTLVGAQFVAASFLMITVFAMTAQTSGMRDSVAQSGQDQLVVITNMSKLTGVGYDTLKAELERLPQVKSVTGDREQPWATSINTAEFSRSPDQAAKKVKVYYERVDYGYFATMDVPVLAGRVYQSERGADATSDQLYGSSGDKTPAVVIDRDTAARLGFASPAAAIGELLYLNPKNTRRIIGVVENQASRFIGMGAASTVYFRSDVLPFQIVRIDGKDISGGLAGIRDVWERLAPGATLNLQFMDDLFGETYGYFQTLNRAFLGMAVFAFVISIIGLFGIAVYAARRRIHEIGVRKTVGARSSQILVMLLKDFSKPVLIANLVAWPLAYFAAQAYLSIFVTRTAVTPLPFVASLAITLVIAWLAVGGQAWRAARVKPAAVLKYE